MNEWESRAAALLPSAEQADLEALRSYTRALLRCIAAGLDAPAGEEKPKGPRRQDGPPQGGAAEAEAEKLLTRGFDVVQLIAEFRALRAGVMKLWERESASRSPDCSEITRFHEAVDQLLSAALTRYNDKLNHARTLFLGTLIHDMRNPLSAITGCAHLLRAAGGGDEAQSRFLLQIERSAATLARLVTTLIEAVRLRLGKGVPISPVFMDMKDTIWQAVKEAKSIRPDSRISVEIAGDLRGTWDSLRIGQVLSNLIGNALQHGSGTPISLVAKEEQEGIAFSVHNEGAPIPPEALPTIFDPLTRGMGENQEESQTTSLGLGLFISREILAAHGGKIGVTSTEEDGTTFAAWLPRAGDADAGAPRH